MNHWDKALTAGLVMLALILFAFASRADAGVISDFNAKYGTTTLSKIVLPRSTATSTLAATLREMRAHTIVQSSAISNEAVAAALADLKKQAQINALRAEVSRLTWILTRLQMQHGVFPH